MTNLVVHPFSKRFVFGLLLIAALAYAFWTTSRYPSLDEKAMMSGAIQLEDPISFEAWFPLSGDMGLAERIGRSTLNWLETNRKGMTFGVLMAAAFLTLFGYLQRRSFQGGFTNAVFGLALGAPLGVCVNCAAPIAQGLYASGVRAEATLAAMIASPTLNIVVLTMAFSLLPVYMAVTKIALSLAVILIVVPLICRMLPKAQLQMPFKAEIDVPAPEGWEVETAPASEGIVRAFFEFARAYLKNLWFIVRITVPLMLLAGLLGAIVATLLPGEMLAGVPFGFGIAVLVALIGTFLPVPIAFDVVMAGALLAGGLAHGYVMVLVFTLGSFSIYSFLIIARAISLRAGLWLAGAVAAIGLAGGAGVNLYYNWQSQRALDILLGAEAAMLPAAHAASLGATVNAASGEVVTLTATPFVPRVGAGGFTRIEAWQVGIDKPIEFSFADMWPPFWEGRSLASGDIDGDGITDLVIASTEAGLYLYRGDGRGGFARMEEDIGTLAGLDVFNAALVDLDNDGWLDLFLTTYVTGNFRVMNLGGRFDFAGTESVLNRDDAMLTLALGFGDLDRDGDLDAVLGNWAAGWYRRIPGEEARNRILFNDGGDGGLTGSTFAELSGIPGETLSLLVSDIDGDGDADIVEGNDFDVPDYLYLGDGQGGFRAIAHQDGLVPHTTTTTMAVKSADLFNDGVPELYFAQIAGRSSGVSHRLRMQPIERYCDGIARDADRAVCQTNMAIKDWYKSGNNFDPSYAARCATLTGRYQSECRAMMVKDLAIQRRDPSVCALIPTAEPRARTFCEIHFRPSRQPTDAEAQASIQQILRSNVLLERGPGGVYADIAPAAGLEVGGWSWDVKIADFDLDGWQDVLIVNGTWVPNEVTPSNMFFLNSGERGFTEATERFGLEDFLITAAANVFDIDGDGDPDILTQPVNGPVTLFRNDTTSGNALAFRLDDRIGNRFGIGARIELEAGGIRQMRELQSGGGFMSFDDPVAWFGLGEAGIADRVTIRWADGGQTVIDGPLQAGHMVRVTRDH